MLVTERLIYFMSTCQSTPEDVLCAERFKNLIIRKEIIITWDSIEEIVKRKLVNVYQGIDILTCEKKLFTFNLCSEERAKEFVEYANRIQKDEKSQCYFHVIEEPKMVL
jgi:hypothetical protein